MVVKCKVCDSVSSKYKCSKCFCPYCSLDCWKVHKDSPNCEPKASINEELSTSNEQKYFTEDTVHIHKLRQLDNSKVKSLLLNPELRAMLQAIDSSSNPSQLMHKAMLTPLFVEFVDECLRTVEDTKE